MELTLNIPNIWISLVEKIENAICWDKVSLLIFEGLVEPS